jgi:membrane-bound metal-dependent hydrolase YbcI (DUF457 family)
MLIGAVGGLAAYKAVEYLDPNVLNIHLGTTYTVPSTVTGLGIILVSAYLALWPDIDEPGTHISHRAPSYMWLLGAIIGSLIAITIDKTSVFVWIAPLAGAIIGYMLGGVLIKLLRFVSGGHRRLTHSLLVGSTLFTAGAVLYWTGAKALALPEFALAWGQALHLIGDVVTPGGVPLFYPIWWENIHFFPYRVSRFGEPIIAVVSLAVGFVLLWF